MSYERPETRPTGQAPAAAPLVRAESESQSGSDLAGVRIEEQAQSDPIEPVPAHDLQKLTDGNSEANAEQA